MILIPCFFFILVNGTLLLPGIILIIVALMTPQRHPACRSCGYDLIGHSGESVTCPECGTRSDVAPQTHGHRRHSTLMLISGLAIIAFVFTCNLFALLWILDKV